MLLDHRGAICEGGAWEATYLLKDEAMRDRRLKGTKGFSHGHVTDLFDPWIACKLERVYVHCVQVEAYTAEFSQDLQDFLDSQSITINGTASPILQFNRSSVLTSSSINTNLSPADRYSFQLVMTKVVLLSNEDVDPYYAFKLLQE